MLADSQLAVLIDQAGIWPMPNGWQVVIRAEWCDATTGRPHELSYALILQDERGQRLLGFDNSHGFDGAGDDDPLTTNTALAWSGNASDMISNHPPRC